MTISEGDFFMIRTMVYHRKKIWVVFIVCAALLLGLVGRLLYLMGAQSEYYSKKADDLHERERDIKAARGKILDINGNILADNRTVCTVSVIHSQMKDPEKVIQVLARELTMDEEIIRKKVEKVSSIERIRTNVEKATGDAIREYALAGVKVDEDYKRYYPCGSLASKVLGFTGGDNQGIIGLEVKYDEILKGEPGKILTVTDARGVEIDGTGERRKEPVAGNTLRTSLDVNIQKYAQQAALKVMEEKQAEQQAAEQRKNATENLETETVQGEKYESEQNTNTAEPGDSPESIPSAAIAGGTEESGQPDQKQERSSEESGSQSES